jgi:uncharacterized protein (DUF433 family)
LKMATIHSANNSRDRRGYPVYSIPDAAYYLGIPVATLRAWALGRPKQNAEGEYPPVLRFVSESGRLSFNDLVEAHILRATIRQKLSLQRLKRGLEFLREYWPNIERPLLTFNFATDGKDLLVKGIYGCGDAELVNATQGGQVEMEHLLVEHLKFIEYDREGYAFTLFPERGEKVVSITAGLYSGRPVIDGTRIPTDTVAQRFTGGETIAELATDYGLSERAIGAAIKYEKKAA